MDLLLTVGLSFGAGALIAVGGWLDNWIKQNDKKDFDLKKFLISAVTTGIVGGVLAIPANSLAPYIDPAVLALITTFIVTTLGKPVGSTYAMMTNTSAKKE